MSAKELPSADYILGLYNTFTDSAKVEDFLELNGVSALMSSNITRLYQQVCAETRHDTVKRDRAMLERLDAILK
ncbi:MAG: hypothetical protein CMH26_06870 [Micavibrio sp.]|nr:hypothetical protein [Micavibrio sp.]|tara:strand:+ start:295 stop:516 length:222 start_codon:yes stop_codon:yes gene_type:complete